MLKDVETTERYLEFDVKTTDDLLIRYIGGMLLEHEEQTETGPFETLDLGERLYTPEEVATLLRRKRITIYRMVRTRRIGHYRDGRSIFIGERHLRDYQAKTEIPAVD